MSVETTRVAKWFLYLGVLNALAAVIFTLPMVIPGPSGTSDLLQMAFAVAFFPGLYILMGYLGFLVVGAAGTIAWAAAYYIIGSAMGKTQTSRGMAMLHLVLGTVGVYGTAVFFFAGGFLGGTARLSGTAKTVDDAMALISWTVLPRMGFIALALVGNLVGVLNALKTMRSKAA
jgi:hypothetical protein